MRSSLPIAGHPATLPAVSPASRRILGYWLLLLLPTLAAGGGGLYLLRREQARLAERETQTAAARHAATTARTGLIIENLELLTEDLQTALLDHLASLPPTGLDTALDRWQQDHPLVRSTFRCTIDGKLLRPAADATDERSRALRRRLLPLLRSALPWAVQPVPATAAVAVSPTTPTDPGTRLETETMRRSASNRSQVQTARREAKELAKATPPASQPLSLQDEYPERRADRSQTEVKPAAIATAATTGDRQGWSSWSADNRTHTLGWVEKKALREIRGLELNFDGLVARLGAALPSETQPDEGYALLDNRARIMHQTGYVATDGQAPAIRIPLEAELFAGWHVVAYLAPPRSPVIRSSGFFLLGTGLIGLCTLAILGSGMLLVSQARRSEAEAAQKTSFVANVSHEFKTPLTTIRLYAELLEQERVQDATRRAEYLRTIGRETQRLARLVGNALDFSRLEQGRKRYQLDRLDLGAELARLLEALEPRLAESGLRLHRTLPAQPLWLRTDRDALEQILLNLLDNACKYAAAGQEVRVALEPDSAGGARIEVADRGPGVPAEHRDRIFEKFHRVDDTLTAEKSGAGLGLAIARQLARGLGGDLVCEPAPGGGARFRLTLPASP